jgi:PAS domain S-box-containing protein
MRRPSRWEWVALLAWVTALVGTGILVFRLLTAPYVNPLVSVGRLDLILGAVFGALTTIVLTVLLLRSEQGLFRTESPSHALLQMPLATLLLVDESGVVQYANAAIEPLLGYVPADLVGFPLADLFPPDARPRVAGLVGPRAPTGTPTVTELPGQRKDGSALPLQLVVESSTWNGHAVSGVLLQDLEEREKLVSALVARGAELARSNRELEQFTYIASHDLQEPLRMVGSYTQLLQRRYGDKLDADAKEFLQYAQDGAARMRDLIDDLLAYSRVGTRPAPFQRVALKALLDRVLSNLRGAIEQSHGTVTVGVLPEVEGDPTQLAQIFQNLIGNALKFHGPNPPHVQVTAVRDGTNWKFAVKDDGIGIAPEYQDRIFVIFQRLHSREEYPGTGIGLAIVRKVVERHGGRIWVESSGKPGEGTSFLFTLPAERARPTPAPVPADAAATRLSGRATSLIEDRLKELV